MTQIETETQVRLRRAKDALEAARTKELDATQALNEARKSKERAKERYSELFAKAEQEEVTRRMSDYRHTTQ